MCNMLLIIFVWLVPHISLHIKASTHYNKFKSIIKTPSTSTYTPSFSSSASLLPAGTHLTAATAYASEHVAWPPTLAHNNWFILQATAKAAVAAESEAIGADMADQQQQRIAGAEARAVKYYAYNNNNSGNYYSPAQDVHIVKPYVLAINNQRPQLIALDENDNRHLLHGNVNGRRSTDRAVNNTDNRDGYVNTTSNNGNNKSLSKHNKDNKNTSIVQSNANNASNIVSHPQYPALFDWKDIEHNSYRYSNGNSNNNDNSNENRVDDDNDDESVEIGSVENNISSLEEAQLDEVVKPLGRVLDKVKQFCDIWKQILRGENEPADLASSSHSIADGGETFKQATNTDTTIPAGDTASQLATEVQGRRSAPTVNAGTAHSIMQQSQTAAPATLLWSTAPRSTAVTASPTTTTSTTRLTTKNSASAVATANDIAKSLTSATMVIGRGKKWKKKLKKLILPLLLAYKLKFIALVPLLIGGLTLLVGSTGLAGFFFALFLTVMSLKSGGNVNKSIIIKKDW